MRKKGFTVAEISDKKFKTLPFTGGWLDKMGEPEHNFKMLAFGAPKSGKSVEILKLADYLTNFGRVLYNSHEEGISQSLQQRIANFGITGNGSKLMFFNALDYDEMVDVAKKGRYKFVIIDSAQYMKFTEANYIDFNARFSSKSLIIISQINAKGKTKGGTGFLHMVDIKLSIVNGYATYESRYRNEKYTIDLYNRNIKKPSQLILDV